MVKIETIERIEYLWKIFMKQKTCDMQRHKMRTKLIQMDFAFIERERERWKKVTIKKQQKEKIKTIQSVHNTSRMQMIQTVCHSNRNTSILFL